MRYAEQGGLSSPSVRQPLQITTISRRLFYPSISVGPNPDNVATALRNMGGENNMRTPVWGSIEAITGKFPIANPEIEK